MLRQRLLHDFKNLIDGSRTNETDGLWSSERCKALVPEMAVKANYFPAKGGISSYFSPRQLLHKEGINYDHHCKFAFMDGWKFVAPLLLLGKGGLENA